MKRFFDNTGLSGYNKLMKNSMRSYKSEDIYNDTNMSGNLQSKSQIEDPPSAEYQHLKMKHISTLTKSETKQLR